MTLITLSIKMDYDLKCIEEIFVRKINFLKFRTHLGSLIFLSDWVYIFIKLENFRFVFLLFYFSKKINPWSVTLELEKLVNINVIITIFLFWNKEYFKSEVFATIIFNNAWQRLTDLRQTWSYYDASVRMFAI